MAEDRSHKPAKSCYADGRWTRALSILGGLGFATLGGLATLTAVNTWYGLLGIPFLLMGCAIIWATLRRPLLRPALTEDNRPALHPSSPVELPPITTPQRALHRCWYMLAGALGFAGMGVAVLLGGPSNDSNVGPVLILVPGALAALLTGISVPNLWFAIHNPAVALSIDKERLRLGGTATLSWHMHGPTRHLKRWSIALVGRERAVDRHSDGNTPQLKVFYRQALYQDDSAQGDDAGSCTLTIPPDAVASFEGGKVGIDWLIEVRGRQSWRPRLHSEHLVQVVP